MKKALLLTPVAMLCATMAMGQQMTDGEEHSKYILAVDEYLPAPGQFVNTMPAYEEGDDAKTMAGKCTKALANNAGGMITLGAYGGYVTFHFDHSIANVKGSADFAVYGNANTSGSEPGIVMVSKDTNRNGLPDDEWFELAGSADTDSLGKVTYGYEITYTPSALQDIQWTDNQGNSGAVARNAFHQQEYFPLWIDGPVTFAGTLLPKNAYNAGTQEQEYWKLNALRYGYADNLPNSETEGNSFNIEWAVDAGRNAVDLDFIDFVRVYSAENQMCGWIGETSTEVTGAEDLHLEASIKAIEDSEPVAATFEETVLASESFWNGSDKTGTQIDGGWGSVAYANSFVSGSFCFENTYNETWSSWSGFAVSNQTSVSYADMADQYHSAVGKGYDGSDNFAVVFPMTETVKVLNKPEGVQLTGMYVTNSAWNVNAYLNGDGMTGKFEAGDWCKLTITGTRADGTTASKEVYLADYRSDDAANHSYLDYWQWVDLSQLGKVKSLSFAVSSTHNNEYGMTTPGYFCMDNLNGKPDATAGIIASTADAPVSEARYTIGGMKVSAPRRGLNIIRMSDGTVKKVMVK